MWCIYFQTAVYFEERQRPVLFSVVLFACGVLWAGHYCLETRSDVCLHEIVQIYNAEHKNLHGSVISTLVWV
jgi:hypothetical protein